MNELRENLIDRMIHIYGYEHETVIKFCRICEKWKDTDLNDKCLTSIVECHENYPRTCGEDE